MIGGGRGHAEWGMTGGIRAGPGEPLRVACPATCQCDRLSPSSTSSYAATMAANDKSLRIACRLGTSPSPLASTTEAQTDIDAHSCLRSSNSSSPLPTSST